MDPMIAQLLTHNGTGPDLNQLLLQLLQNRLEQQAPDNPDQPLERSIGRLRRKNRLLRWRLLAANRFVEGLARLMGACPRCFGQDDDCPLCHGGGAPGSRQPATELAAWMQPALERLGYRLVPGEQLTGAGRAPESSN